MAITVLPNSLDLPDDIFYNTNKEHCFSPLWTRKHLPIQNLEDAQ